MKQNLVSSLWKVLPAVCLALGFDVGSVRAFQQASTSPSSGKIEKQTGPETEKRFPPLQLPTGFQATLFACDPLVEYPSVIALGPEPGSLFVVHDYVTGLGIEIVRRDEIRLIRDTDGDGYADKSTLYAEGFNSIQGLAYHAGSVYVMHAPLLTSLKDTDGDGVAEERRDILNGLGLPPEKNPNRLHCANGVVVGHDGWLYLALGDRGCDVKRYEGDRLLFQQGGILRCRPDGRDLHVFSGGLRNIYDVVLDEELNVFVRDNENDGGDYMIRVCHSFHGADHGYPYLYYERPAEAMLPLADLGRGSSAGGTSYLESAFPKEYRESLFFCEWGRAVVRYHQRRAGSSFASMKEIDFAAGAPDDPYGFKPTDLVVDTDGSLLISDWGDGQRPKRGRARIYRITHVDGQKKSSDSSAVSGKTEFNKLVSLIGSDSYYIRVAAQEEIERRGPKGIKALKQAMKTGKITGAGRYHAIWAVAHVGGKDSVNDLFHIAETDSDPRVRAQAVRALADLTDPILTEHRLAAERGDKQIAARLAGLVTKQQDSRVVLEVMVALGRLRWSAAPDWLRKHWNGIKHDPALEHAAQQLLRRADNWAAVLKLLDEPDDKTAKAIGLRTLALRAVANRVDKTVVDGIISRLKKESDPQRRREYADRLALVQKQPAPWVYWGFRPAPRPANTVAWDRTEPIESVLNDLLADTDSSVRMLTLKRLRREKIPIQVNSLAKWLQAERNSERVTAILEALNNFQTSETRELIENVVRSREYSNRNRLDALAGFSRRLDASSEKRLLTVAERIEDGPVLAAVLVELGKRARLKSDQLLLSKLDSSVAEVRAAALKSLAVRKVDQASPRVVSFLRDADVRVRRAAASAAGALQVQGAVERLRELAGSDDRELCRVSLLSLKQLRDFHAVGQAVAALDHPETQLAAVSYLEEFGSVKQMESLKSLAASNRSSDILTGVVRALSQWQKREDSKAQARLTLEQAIAEIQAQSGVLMHWSTLGPLQTDEASRWIQQLTDSKRGGDSSFHKKGWRSRFATGTDASIRLQADSEKKKTSGTTWLAVSGLYTEEPGHVEFLAAGNGTLQVWLNGKSLYHREKPAAYRPNSDRFEATLKKGPNRLLVKMTDVSDGPRFHLRFRRKSSKAEHERLIRLALTSRGNVQRGREVFLNAEKSQCVKCHRLGDQQTGRIGPDLTGIGSRFSRIHLIESLLEPSRTVAPSYATVVVVLESGQVITGVKISETETMLTLGDNQGKTYTVSKSDIEESRVQAQSTMPDGLEKKLTDREFFDLLTFLLSQKKNQSN